MMNEVLDIRGAGEIEKLGPGDGVEKARSSEGHVTPYLKERADGSVSAKVMPN